MTPSPTGLLSRLADAGVDFVVIGGIAVVAQGHIRTTRDLDITYGTTPENLETLGRALVALDARLRGAELLTLETSLGSLDLLAKPPGAPAYPALKMGAEPIELDGREVLIASIEDLIAMKRTAGRPRDLDDIEALE